MTQPTSQQPTPRKTSQRTRMLIFGAIGVVIAGILIKGLLTPATSPAVGSAQATPGPAAPVVGHYAPSITVHDLSNNPVSLSSLRGKVVALNFWYAACEPCKLEMPALERTYQKYQKDGFVVLGVDVTDNATTTAAFVKEVGVTYPVVRDLSLQTVAAYRIVDTPSTFFIDRNGVIRYKVVGALDNATLTTDVNALLK